MREYEAPTDPTDPIDPIAAVTHPDPYLYYAELAARRPMHWDASLECWVAAGADAVRAVLESEDCRVRPLCEPVPARLVGSPAGEIFRRLVRMNDGAEHRRLRRVVCAEIPEVASLGEGGGALGDLSDLGDRMPVEVLAGRAGVPQADLHRVVEWIRAFARCVPPGASVEQVEEGKTAAQRLLLLFRSLRPNSDDSDDALANRIGLLFQAYESTAGLIGNVLVALRRSRSAPRDLTALIEEVLRADPPVQNTRRYVAADTTVAGARLREGDTVLVVLAAPGGFAFGFGAHACPGAELSKAIAAHAVRRLVDAGFTSNPGASLIRYRPSANVRIPLLVSRA